MLNLDYSFLVGHIRALEAKLLNDSQLNRMVEAHDARSAYQVLNDTDFQDELASFPNLKDFASLLENSLLNTKKLILKTVNDPEEIKTLFVWYDFYNFKVVCKAYLKQESFDSVKHLLSPFGNEAFDVFKNLFYDERSYENWSGIKDEVLAVYSKDKDLMVVDSIADRAMFVSLLKFAEDLNSDLLKKYYQKLIDCINAQTALRNLNKASDRPEIFIEGGEILSIDWQKDPQQIKNNVIKVFSSDNIIKDFEDHNNYILLQKEMGDLLFHFMKETRYLTDGILPVIGYWYTRVHSAEIIRAVLVAKMNKLSSSEIRKSIKKLV